MATDVPRAGAPTEADIRAAIDRAVHAAGDIDIGQWVHAILRPLDFAAPSQRGAAYEPATRLWDDLRPSEAARLEELREGVYNEIQPLEDDVVGRIREAAIRAAMTFAAERGRVCTPSRAGHKAPTGAPTQAEIHEAILGELGDRTLSSDDFGGLVDGFRVVLDSDMARVREPSGWDPDMTPGDGHPGTLWADMTAAEGAELHEALQAVLRRVLADATAELVAGCVTATEAFAERHPDIPRGRWRPGPSATVLVPASRKTSRRRAPSGSGATGSCHLRRCPAG